MSGDGTTDRGAKPPRTLFSLGRPGPKSGTAEVEPEGANGEVTAGDGGAAEPTAEAVELACGACGTTLIPGAAFCGECGTPVAQLDDEPFDLVEEVPMADLEDGDFGEYVEELPIDDAPGVLYADADATPATDAATDAGDDSAGATVIAQPAAVLYADPSQAEPLPPAPTGTFAISEPSYGTADGAIGEAGADAVPTDAATTDAGEPAAVGTAGETGTDTSGETGTDTAAEPETSIGEATPAAADSDSDTDDGVGAAPLAAGAAVGGAVLGAELAGHAAEAGAATGPSDAEVLADLAGTTDVAPVGGSAAAGDATTADGSTETASSPWADAPAEDAAAGPAPVGDAPTAVEPAVLPIAGAAAMSGAGTPATPVAAAAYGTTPPESGGGKSKTGLLIGVAAAVVLLLIVGGVIIASSGGDKDGGVQTAQQVTTTAAPSSTTTAPSSTTQGPTTTGPSTTAPTSTSDPSTTDTTVATVTTVATPVPTTPRVTVTQAPTTVAPGRIVANPPAGSTVNIPKGGSTTITLQNVGGTAAGCALTGSNGITASQNCSPSIPPGGVVTVVVTANPTWEGPATVTGVLEGAGSYTLTVFVMNN